MSVFPVFSFVFKVYLVFQTLWVFIKCRVTSWNFKSSQKKLLFSSCDYIDILLKQKVYLFPSCIPTGEGFWCPDCFFHLVPISFSFCYYISFSVFSRNGIFTYFDGPLMPAQLREQTLSWNVCGCLGESYSCIFCQKLFSRSVQSQISACFLSFPDLRCISLPFSVRVHYFSSILFLHVVTPNCSTFFFIWCFSFICFSSSNFFLSVTFCDYLDIFPYSLWFHLSYDFLEYFQHFIKNFELFSFFLLFFLIFWFSWYVQMDFKSHSHDLLSFCCSKIVTCWSPFRRELNEIKG